MKILECHSTINLLILPVFYHVNPSDVRCQKDRFGELFEDLMRKALVTEEKERRYRESLIKAVHLSTFNIDKYKCLQTEQD